MKTSRFAAALAFPSIAMLFVIGSIAPLFAHGEEKDDHVHARKTPNELVQIVRTATERFKDPAAAEAEGYLPLFGCVSGDEAGAMGQHFVNGTLVGDDVLDPTKPEIVIYEPNADGTMRLIGADYLVFADVWHQTHAETPAIMGQQLHYFAAPNRFGLPPFYTLHVWAWKDSPTGMFVNWHSNVSCEGAR